MQTTDQVIDNILLNSPYGAKAYEARQKRIREQDQNLHIDEEIIEDHPQQTYIKFEEFSND